MTITRRQIQRMRTHARMHIDAELEEMILAEYGVEPDPYEYTEQDLHEQIRKMVNRYNQERDVHRRPAEHSKPWELSAPHANPTTDTKGVNG